MYHCSLLYCHNYS